MPSIERNESIYACSTSGFQNKDNWQWNCHAKFGCREEPTVSGIHTLISKGQELGFTFDTITCGRSCTLGTLENIEVVVQSMHEKASTLTCHPLQELNISIPGLHRI